MYDVSGNEHTFREDKCVKIVLPFSEKGSTLKCFIFLKNRLFIQERFTELINDINTIIKCDIWQPVKFLFNWIKNEIIFYRFSELMLAGY